MISQDATSDGAHRNTPDPAQEPPSFDTTVAHPARVYDYLLGGKDNYEADRQAAEQAIAVNPDILSGVRANRAFLKRAVQYLAGEAGIRQFLDIGTGLPTAENTHEVAQAIAPESRVVYADNDPIVLAHARALLASSPAGATAYIHADARDAGQILAAAADTLDFSQPVAVMFLMTLMYIPDSDGPRQIVADLMDAMPPGSYLAISDLTRDFDTERADQSTARLNERMGPIRQTRRTHAEIARYFDGLELVEPGLVVLPEWRGVADPEHIFHGYAGIGRKSPGLQADPDDEHLAELAREVVRRQERHREGGVEPGLIAPGPGPAAPGPDPEPAG